MATDTDERLEVRIAPVMTGGVSLAVWTGGVTCELYRAVTGDGVYRELLDTMRERVVVDVITGTSAGGLNGVLLAAALAWRLPVKEFARLRDVWLDDGSIGDLLRSPFEPDPPSLLKGDDHFLVRIRHHLDRWYGMTQTRSPQPPNSEDAGTELVLLVTATTLSGEPERFADDFGQPINQSTHEALFTFRGNDLLTPNAPARLALAARTSSSFPGAFEPSFCPVNEAGPGGQPDVAGIASFSRSRYAVDGGVLRNLPLGPAIDAVFRQPAQGRVRRLLAYVNPDPPPPLDEPADTGGVPSLALVLGASLVTLPRHESVASHLREIKEHNRRVRQQQESRRSLLRVTTDVETAAATVYEDFKQRRIDDSVRGTSAQVVRRALRLSIDEDVGIAAEDALRACAHEPILWFPRTFPVSGLVPADEQEQAPWPWGISPLEYAGSMLVELLRQAYATADLDAEAKVRIRQQRALIGEAITTLGALRGVDDAFWAVRTTLLATPGIDVAVWARKSYEQWPAISRPTLDKVRNAYPELVESYDSRAAVIGAAVREPLATRATLHDIAMTFAAAAWVTRAELTRLAAGDEDAGVVVRAILGGDASGDADADAEVEIARRLLAIFVVQVAVGGAGSPREQVVDLLQVSSHLCHPVDARQRGSAVGKLTGVGLHHFAAFFKRSWRANDWMWGRLDGADRLVLALLDPARLKARCVDANAACDEVRRLALGSGDDAAALAETYDAEGIGEEIATLYGPDAAPTSLPKAAQAVARRLHLEILREELPAVAEAARRSEQAGGALGENAAAFVRAVDGAAGPPSQWSPAVVGDLLRECRIGEETVPAEIGSDAMTVSVAQAAAVAASALRGSRSGLGPARHVLRSIRAVVVILYALVRSAVSGGPVGTIVVAGGLATSGTVVALRATGVAIDGTWVAFSVALLVIWSLLAVVTSGMPLAALPLLAVPAVAVAFNGERLADALAARAGERGALLDNPEVTGRVLAGMFAVAMLVTAASALSAVAARGWWRKGVVVRGVAAFGFGGLAWYAKLELPDDLRDFLADPDPGSARQQVITWLKGAHRMRVAVAAVALPLAAVLLEAGRRLPRGITRAVGLVRRTRFDPAFTGRAAVRVAGAVALTAGVAATSLLDTDVADGLRSGLGAAAAWFVLFPPGSGKLAAGIDRSAADVATRVGGRMAAALCIPIAVAWAAGLVPGADDDPTTGVVVVHVVVILLGVACLEEVVFRGAVLRLLAFGGNATSGVLLSSLAFGLSHVAVADGGLWGGVATVAFTTLAGLLFAWLHLRTRSLIAPVVVHAAVNAAGYLAVVGS